MRPAGEVRQLLARALATGPGTSRDHAARVCISVDLARTTLDNMVRAGAARKLDEPARVPGVRRPVPVYAGVA